MADPFTLWLAARTVRAPGETIAQDDLYRDFCDWSAGPYAGGKDAFDARLTQAGYPRGAGLHPRTGAVITVHVGLGLVPNPDAPGAPGDRQSVDALTAPYTVGSTSRTCPILASVLGLAANGISTEWGVWIGEQPALGGGVIPRVVVRVGEVAYVLGSARAREAARNLFRADWKTQRARRFGFEIQKAILEAADQVDAETRRIEGPAVATVLSPAPATEDAA